MHVKVEIICKIHGLFNQKACRHIQGDGCIKCSGLQLKSKELFISDAKKIHGDKYDYSKLKYLNSASKVKIICNIHGAFLQNANSHVLGSGCSKCTKTNLDKINPNGFTNLCQKASEKNGKCLDTEYKGLKHKYTWECSKGHIWKQNAHNIMSSKNSWCPICNESKGEKSIVEILEKLNIGFIREQGFEGFGRYEFDFHLPQKNIIIEYDGEQHFSFRKKKDCIPDRW